MNRATKVGLAIAFPALLGPALGLLHSRQQAAEPERQRTAIRVRLKEAEEQVARLRAENEKLKQSLERETLYNRGLLPE